MLLLISGLSWSPTLGVEINLNKLKNKTKQTFASVKGEQKLDWSQLSKEMEYRQLFQETWLEEEKRQ